MIVYLWTTVARETPVPYSSLGVSDNHERAQAAAEHYLRSGQARLAFVETARTAMAACSFTPCYLRTGLGWSATADPAGEVTWAMYTGPEVAAELRSLPTSAEVHHSLSRWKGITSCTRLTRMQPTGTTHSTWVRCWSLTPLLPASHAGAARTTDAPPHAPRPAPALRNALL